MIPALITIILLILVPLKLGGAMLCLLVPMEKNFTLCGIKTKLYMYSTFNRYTHGLVAIKCAKDFKTSDKVMDYAGIVCSEDDNWQHLSDMFPYHFIMYCTEQSTCHYFRNWDEGKPLECSLDCKFWEKIPLT